MRLNSILEIENEADPIIGRINPFSVLSPANVDDILLYMRVIQVEFLTSHRSAREDGNRRRVLKVNRSGSFSVLHLLSGWIGEVDGTLQIKFVFQ